MNITSRLCFMFAASIILLAGCVSSVWAQSNPAGGGTTQSSQDAFAGITIARQLGGDRQRQILLHQRRQRRAHRRRPLRRLSRRCRRIAGGGRQHLLS
jgi:hypothetical protein